MFAKSFFHLRLYALSVIKCVICFRVININLLKNNFILLTKCISLFQKCNLYKFQP
jgi:hypothetical protein